MLHDYPSFKSIKETREVKDLIVDAKSTGTTAG